MRAAVDAAIVTDGELLNPNAWVMSAGGTGTSVNHPAGQLNINAVGAQAQGDQQVRLDVGHTYTLSAQLSASAVVRMGNTPGGTGILSATPAAGAYTVDVVATAGAPYVRFAKTTGDLVVTNISLRKKS